MNIKNLFTSMFAYNPSVDYDFSLPDEIQDTRKQ